MTGSYPHFTDSSEKVTKGEKETEIQMFIGHTFQLFKQRIIYMKSTRQLEGVSGQREFPGLHSTSISNTGEFTRNSNAYITGTTPSVNRVENNNPAMIAIAIGSHISPPPK